MRRWLLGTVLVMGAGCASGRTATPPSDLEPPEPEVVWERVLDRSALDRAEDALDDGDRAMARSIGDSLWTAWVGNEQLDSGSAEDLVSLLDALGAEDRAASVWLHVPYELDGGERRRLRELASQLSIREMETLLAAEGVRTVARSVLTAELARALAVADRPEQARRLAESVLAGTPDGPDRDKAEDVVDGSVRVSEDSIKIGVVLPASGRFAGVGEQVLEGAMLALELHRANPGTPPVDLVVLDDSSRVDLGIELIEELEDANVAAVLGPLRTEAFERAAVRRERTDLTLLSPTASGGQGVEPNAYSLWDRDRREADVAVALASWLSKDLGLDSLGVLYPYGWSPYGLEALRAAVEENGGSVVAAQPYAADSTTFGAPIAALAAAEPEAVIVFADRPRTVLQLAPQLVYYGLRRWVTAGDANWADPTVVRRLDPSYSDHRLVGIYVDRISADTPWRRFETIYEARYRKALPDNYFTALGFDGMNLILAGVPEAEWKRRGAIGRSIRRETHEGATGKLSVDPGSGGLGRKVSVRMLEDGQLVVPDVGEVLTWAQEQRELEEFLNALEEEKEQEEGGR